jgi:hypothetical protein
VLVIAVPRNGDDLGAYACALLWDVALVNVLSGDGSSEGGDEGKLGEEHVDGWIDWGGFEE